MKRALLTIISSALILVIGIASTVTVAVVGKKVDLEFVDYASTGVYDRDVFLSNPSGVRFAADAQVLHAEDDRYYMYATSDGLGGYGFYCWTSEDLATWSSPSVCFNPSAADWGKGAYWAPEVTESEDENGELVYYLHYSAKLIDGNDSLNRLGVATSSSPGGPFRNMRNGYDGRILRRSVWGDETSAKIAFEGNAIDIHLFRDTDGKLYCYFAELSSSGGYTALRIFGSEMEEDYCTLLTEPVLLLSPLIQDGMQQDWEVENVNEGPEMIKRGDTYYLTYSGNGYVHANYGIGYATSQSPLGPFAKSEANPIIVRNNNIDRPTGTGHHGVLQLDDGEWYSFYHSHIDMNVSTAARQINIARLGWREDGSMYACGPTEVPVLRPVGEYKNLAPLASVSSKKTECDPSVLTDGEIITSGDYGHYDRYLYYSIDKGEDPYADSANGKDTITLKFSKPQSISAVAVYACLGMDEFERAPVTIVLDGKYVMKNVTFSEALGNVALAQFNPRKVKKVELIFNQDTPVLLSEIMILGK